MPRTIASLSDSRLDVSLQPPFVAETDNNFAASLCSQRAYSVGQRIPREQAIRWNAFSARRKSTELTVSFDSRCVNLFYS